MGQESEAVNTVGASAIEGDSEDEQDLEQWSSPSPFPSPYPIPSDVDTEDWGWNDWNDPDEDEEDEEDNWDNWVMCREDFCSEHDMVLAYDNDRPRMFNGASNP